MKRMTLNLIFFLSLISFSFRAKADSVILMIGDGMGKNHIDCVGRDHSLFLDSMYPQFYLYTSSANNEVTDSAASATAYSCGLKTNNSYLGLDPHGNKCTTIAELAAKLGKDVYIISSDYNNGATPSAFYAHTNSRYNDREINDARRNASESMNFALGVQNVYETTTQLLDKLKNSANEYFVMIEAAYIDKGSHDHNYQVMEKSLVDFDQAIKAVWEFAQNKRDIHVFVTADHETGGLNQNCEYTIKGHTAANVPVYALSYLFLPIGSAENTRLYDLMYEALLK